MKKFLLILLIAVAASVSVEFDGTELNGWFSNLFHHVKDFFKNIGGKLKKFVNWLKDNGIWDKLVDLVKNYGGPKAVKYCEENAPSSLKDQCKETVDKVIENLRK